MIYSNDESVQILKMILMITGLSCVVLMTILIFLQQFIFLAFLTGAFLLGLIFIRIFNFQNLYIGENKNRLIVRYFSVFSINRSYQTVEIPIEFLQQIKVKKHFPGVKWDLTFTVKVRKGIAEYPPISLSAVPFKQRSKLITQLNFLIPVNSTNL